jgi:hypothetical protein
MVKTKSTKPQVNLNNAIKTNQVKEQLQMALMSCLELPLPEKCRVFIPEIQSCQFVALPQNIQALMQTILYYIITNACNKQTS